MEQAVHIKQSLDLRARRDISGIFLNGRNRFLHLLLNFVHEILGHAAPVVSPDGLRDNVRAADAPVVHAVAQIPDGGFHSAARRGRDDERLLAHQRQVGTVHQPAVRKVVEQGLDLPRNVVNVGRRTENDQLGVVHRGDELLHVFVPAALVLAAVHACIAARADMRHILRQIKFVQRAARKQAVEHHLCNAVGGRFGFPFVRIEYGYVHSEHPFLCRTSDRIRDFRFVDEHGSPLRLHICR